MNVTPSVSSARIGRTLILLRAHKRRIVFGLIFVYAAFLLVHPDEDGRVADLIWLALLVMFIASQVFWIRRFIPLRTWRIVLTALLGALYALSIASLLFGPPTSPLFPAADRNPFGILLAALFWWWFVGSFLGFFLDITLWIVDRAARVL